jgi:ribosomal protein S18 acetylase RimI-like enzyme
MTGDEVVRCEQADRLVAPIVLAFSADPFVRWLLPGSSEFLTFFPRITRLHAERTTATGGAYVRADGCGAAAWYPAGIDPDGEALGDVLTEAGVVEKVSMVFGEVAAYEPSEPHWYLRQIGVDPRLQRAGHGSALLTAGLADVDRRKQVAYLEATSQSSKTFYERHGFTVAGEVQVADSPPLWPMVRQPRTT